MASPTPSKALYRVLVKGSFQDGLIGELGLTKQGLTPYDLGCLSWNLSLTMRRHSPGWGCEGPLCSVGLEYCPNAFVTVGRWRLWVTPSFTARYRCASLLKTSWPLCCSESSLYLRPVLFVAMWYRRWLKLNTLYSCAYLMLFESWFRQRNRRNFMDT